MGFSLFLVWRKGVKGNERAICLFMVQLFLNFLWSFLFFSFQNILYAFIEIVALLAVLVLTFFEFYKISRRAGLLLIPYIAWVIFASVLNLSLLFLN